MPTVTFVHLDGQRETLEADAGQSIMRVARTNVVRGILADCATCHVYVAEAFVDKIPTMADIEDQMLGAMASERLPNSRLSCQIMLMPEIDGIEVAIPPQQT
jgi:ferredoxin, 2Fe-2S